jgi:hypothetical protein
MDETIEGAGGRPRAHAEFMYGLKNPADGEREVRLP